MRKKKKQQPEDTSEEETDSKDGGTDRGTSLDIKQGIMQRLEHLNSNDNHRCPLSPFLCCPSLQCQDSTGDQALSLRLLVTPELSVWQEAREGRKKGKQIYRLEICEE